jgi:N-acetylneuraminate synthase
MGRRYMSLPSLHIAGRRIAADEPPYIIAEMSANHNGDISKAFQIIQKAKECGADALKIQTYTPDTITLDSNKPDFLIKEGLWAGQTLYDLYKSAYTPWEWHKDLFEYSRKIGITMFSSPFDTTAVDLLEDLNVPAYKIASFEATDTPLIEYVASTKKPMIISTGMANGDEIQEAIDAAKSAGCKELAILHCVSGYPAPPENYNLKTLTNMIDRYDCVTGLSDHTLDNITAIASVALGASIIEKHFTIDRSAGGPDDSFSMEPADLTDLVKMAKGVFKSLGVVDYGLKSSEVDNVKFRRSLYYVKDLPKNHILTNEDIKSVRPGFGIAPSYFKEVLGKRLKYQIEKHSPVGFGDFEKVDL